MSILAKGAALVALLLGVVVPAAVQVLAQAELGQWEMPAGAVAGKTAIVTGANSGLGLETARVLAAGGRRGGNGVSKRRQVPGRHGRNPPAAPRGQAEDGAARSGRREISEALC